MKFFNGKWAFLLAGLLLGAALIAGIQFYGRECGCFDALNAGGKFIESEITQSDLQKNLSLNAQLAILLGILVGAPLGALATGSFKPALDGDGNFFLSLIRNLAGGFLIMTGIEIATESIWGHFAGAIRLAGGSWIFLGALCASGVLASLCCGGKPAAAKSEKEPKKGAKK